MRFSGFLAATAPLSLAVVASALSNTCKCSPTATSFNLAPTTCPTVTWDNCDVDHVCSCKYTGCTGINGRDMVRCGNHPMCVPVQVCPPGTNVCDDPHMQGLSGQRIEWYGADGGWYCLFIDEEADLHVNVRVTAPLPDDFPTHQFVTGVAVLSGGDSLVIEVKDPYSIHTDGCPSGISPCLADGGLRISVNGDEAEHLLSPTKDEYVAGDIELSSSNLPAECREFGGSEIWARMYEEMLEGKRELASESFEDWVLSFDRMAAPLWCAKYIAEHGLNSLQSAHSLFRVSTPAAVVRFAAGVNHRNGGEFDMRGRSLPELDFWQTGVGLDGVTLEHEGLSGMLGETTEPVLDVEGRAVMEGMGALRGNVEDYRVSGALETQFALLEKKKNV